MRFCIINVLRNDATLMRRWQQQQEQRQKPDFAKLLLFCVYSFLKRIGSIGDISRKLVLLGWDHRLKFAITNRSMGLQWGFVSSWNLTVLCVLLSNQNWGFGALLAGVTEWGNRVQEDLQRSTCQGCQAATRVWGSKVKQFFLPNSVVRGVRVSYTNTLTRVRVALN